NFNIIQVNQITRAVWDRLSKPFMRDLAEYARRYKIEYPNLRKRGVSAYSVFLMVIHGLIRRFSIKTADAEKCSVVFDQLLLKMSVFKLIEFKILKPVRMSYQLNQENWGSCYNVTLANDRKIKYISNREVPKTDNMSGFMSLCKIVDLNVSHLQRLLL
ncbi:MAG TPA: hypothetical protein PKJ08_12160, partial [Candidatus Cloacimonadota bacterium]|nr:hypothetical protein [Candidatus Cloacimonadota bacterium]